MGSWSGHRQALLLLPRQVPAAAVPILSNLLCFCSIATVTCVWYSEFLPPTLFGVSCRRNVTKTGEYHLPTCGAPGTGMAAGSTAARRVSECLGQATVAVREVVSSTVAEGKDGLR